MNRKQSVMHRKRQFNDLMASMKRVVHNYCRKHGNVFKVFRELMDDEAAQSHFSKELDDFQQFIAEQEPEVCPEFKALYSALMTKDKFGLVQEVEDVEEIIEQSDGLRAMASTSWRYDQEKLADKIASEKYGIEDFHSCVREAVTALTALIKQLAVPLKRAKELRAMLASLQASSAEGRKAADTYRDSPGNRPAMATAGALGR